MKHYRDLGVWLVCIPVRLAIGLVTLWVLRRHDAPPWVRYSLAAYAAWTALGFWVQALVIQPEVGGFGGVVWWGEVRWAHAALWSWAAVLLLAFDRWWAAVPLLVDVAVAVAATAHHQLRRVH